MNRPTGPKVDIFGGSSDPRRSAYAAASAGNKMRDEMFAGEAPAHEALGVAQVVELRDTRMLISLGPGNSLDVAKIDGAKVGHRVLCNRNTMAATEVIVDEVPTGIIVTCARADHDLGVAEGEVIGHVRAFRCAHLKPRKGERLIVDQSLTFVIGTLGMPPATHAYQPKIEVGWDDIGGQEEAKAALREAIELPLAHPQLFKAYGKTGVKGVLLWGPSGTGKTIMAKAAATAIAKAHGKNASEGFVYVKGPELLNKFIGASEENVRGLFQGARKHKETHGYPALIFLDECEALLGSRDRNLHASVNATVVPQFLAEMDGLEESAAIFVLATNRPDMLDPAVTRDGRVDRKVRVGRPSRDDAAQIFEIHLRDRPTIGGGHVTRAVAELFSDDRVFRELGDGLFLRLRDLVSGAMIAGIVERASTAAVMRDIARGARRPNGIEVDDLVWAIGKAEDDLAATNHGEAVKEMAEVHEAQKLAAARPR